VPSLLVKADSVDLAPMCLVVEALDARVRPVRQDLTAHL
jgi:hypothetical protein